jgi:hypothetical protein
MAEWLRKIKRNRLGYGARLASVDGAPLAAQVRTENDKATDCKLQVTSVNSEKQKHKRLFGKCTRHFDGSKVGILTTYRSTDKKQAYCLWPRVMALFSFRLYCGT